MHAARRRPHVHLRRGVARVLVAAGAVLLLAACNLQQDVTEPSGSLTVSPTPAPIITGATTTGAEFSWSSTRGRVVVLDFWGSWCGPCRAEQHDINALYSRYAARGVLFVGVDMRDDDASANAYRHDYSVAYPSVGDSSETIAADYDVTAPPTVVVVDQHGDIVQRFLGTVAGVSDLLDSLLR